MLLFGFHAFRDVDEAIARDIGALHGMRRLAETVIALSKIDQSIANSELPPGRAKALANTSGQNYDCCWVMPFF